MERADGRTPEDLRPVRIERNYLEFAEGSCLITFGKTRVLCSATVEMQVPQWLKGAGRGWVTAEYSMLPRSTMQRTRREVSAGRPAGRTHEIQRLIGRSLRAVVDLAALGDATITVDCDCLVSDGGTRTAAITGGYVALVDAMRWMRSEGKLETVPVSDHVAAVSVGVIDGVACLDLDYSEDVRAEVDMNVVMTGSGLLVEVQGTAEGRPFGRDVLGSMLDLGVAGIAQLVEAQRASLGE